MDKKLKRNDSLSSLCDANSSTENLPKLKKNTTVLDSGVMEPASHTPKTQPTDCVNIEQQVALNKTTEVHYSKKDQSSKPIKKQAPKKKRKKKTLKKKKTRCYYEDCRVKLTRFPIVCCCGHSYCGKHYDKPSHKCSGKTTNDFKQDLKQMLPNLRPHKISDI